MRHGCCEAEQQRGDAHDKKAKEDEELSTDAVGDQAKGKRESTGNEQKSRIDHPDLHRAGPKQPGVERHDRDSHVGAAIACKSDRAAYQEQSLVRWDDFLSTRIHRCLSLLKSFPIGRINSLAVGLSAAFSICHLYHCAGFLAIFSLAAKDCIQKSVDSGDNFC